MKINLSEKQVEELKNSLLARNVANFEYDGKIFFVRLDKVNFNEKDTGVNHVAKLQEAFSNVIEDVMSDLGQQNTFTTFARNKFKDVFPHGKMITIYFGSNDKVDSLFPHELISRNDWDAQIAMKHDYQ
ncbi:hypothetical protein [Bacillus toyonensis]|uniref:hypothetical protein n=1 Tax=Bacillus toyonensis TaxID=155322 RepID=UPI00027960DA|nr:hypothetical protein [Bacillus toyonensis]EJQ72397.1 hypothetical protein IGK_05556 [Bacillus toyonensis]